MSEPSAPAVLVDALVVRDLAGITADSGEAFVLELLSVFAADARRALERMRGFARAGEAGLLAREAHRLKGSSGTMGAARLAGACLEIERRARGGSCGGIESRIDDALGLLEATCGGIAGLVGGGPRPVG